MAACLNVYAQRQTVGRCLIESVYEEVVFGINADSVREFVPSAQSKRPLVVTLARDVNQITMNKGGGQPLGWYDH